MQRPDEPIVLIAHRGGVIEGRNPENSPAALDEAISRGYDAVEIDLRSTADGEVVCYHDATVACGFLRRRRIRDLELAELRGCAGSWILTVDEMLARCVGRVRVMLDVKDETDGPEFYERIDASLHAHGMAREVWAIGTHRSKEALRDTVRTAVSVRQIKRGERPLESITETEFIFGHGTELDDSFVSDALGRGLALVPSINHFHYLPRLDTAAPAGSDILRLLALGVTVFQIDSDFDRFFPGYHR